MIKYPLPCDSCLKLAVCLGKNNLKCRDLFFHLHTKYSVNHTKVDMNGDIENRNMDTAAEIQSLFKKHIIGVNRLSYSIRLYRGKGQA